MQYLPQHIVKSLGFVLCLFLASCEGSQLGDSLEKNLEPDPRLVEEETATNETASTPGTTATPAAPNEAEPAEEEAATSNQPEGPEPETPVTPTFTQTSYRRSATVYRGFSGSGCTDAD